MRKKPRDVEEDGRTVDQEQANALDALSEGLPEAPLPTEGLPALPTLQIEEEPMKTKAKDGKGLEKALKIMDEYEKGVPPRNPHVQNYEE